MSNSRDKRIDEIYTGAIERSGAQRDEFVKQECGCDEDLKQQVLTLIKASESPDDNFDDWIDEVRNRVLRSVFEGHVDAGEDLSGLSIKNWRLEKRIARGGLATVYLAHRDDGEFDQKVAFKVLRRGLDTDDLVARFRAERQILSTMEHPSITHILDGGSLDDGRPYLVLEFVDGVPITDYCEQNGLKVQDRVILMAKVLRALHHAHTHLVVHRDVKPSNILVSKEGNISLLDFGIAKLLDPESLPGASTMTRTGVSLLTPGYGSPEQHAGEAVTTVSDIYQCGLVLYEMLTGQPSYKIQPRPGGVEPLVPSHALRGKPGFKEVRGDLDAIVRKATHQDPKQRYVSADEMVSDLQHFLDGLPVAARPDSLGYRVAKLVKRRPWLIPVTVTVVLGVAAYVTTLTIYNKQLRVEQQRATAAQDFLVDLLRNADPFQPASPGKNREMTVAEALDIGVKRLHSGQYDDPRLKESLLLSIADAYRSLDRHQQGIELRHEVLNLQRELYGEHSTEVIASLRVLSNEHRTLGDYANAEKYNDEQLNLARAIYAENHPGLGVAEISAGRLHRSLGNRAQSEKLLENGIAKLRGGPDKYAGSLINAVIWLAGLRGERLQEETLEMLAEARKLADTNFGEESMKAAMVQTQTASSLSVYGEHGSAEVIYGKAIAMYEAQLGRDHGSTLAALNSLAKHYIRSSQFERAENVHREVLEHYITKYGMRHRGVAESYQNLAVALSRQDRYEAAIPLHRKAIESLRAVLGDDTVAVVKPLLSIAYAELSLGNAGGAEIAAAEALVRLKTSVAELSQESIAYCMLGLSLKALGKTDAGNEAYRKARKQMEDIELPNPYAELCGIGN